jgi:hypothetical protein
MTRISSAVGPEYPDGLCICSWSIPQASAWALLSANLGAPPALSSVRSPTSVGSLDDCFARPSRGWRPPPSVAMRGPASAPPPHLQRAQELIAGLDEILQRDREFVRRAALRRPSTPRALCTAPRESPKENPCSLLQPNPWGLAADEATDTINTANLADGEGPGTVSVINGATCNGQDITGCGQTPATAPAGFGTISIAVDQLTNRVYATNLQDSSVTTINGNSCNGTNTDGCGHTRANAIVGHGPGAIAVDPSLDTAYVADGGGVSVIPLGNH